MFNLLLEFQETYGDIVLEVTSSGVQIVHLFDRKDIGKLNIIKKINSFI